MLQFVVAGVMVLVFLVGGVAGAQSTQEQIAELETALLSDETARRLAALEDALTGDNDLLRSVALDLALGSGDRTMQGRALLHIFSTTQGFVVNVTPRDTSSRARSFHDSLIPLRIHVEALSPETREVRGELVTPYIEEGEARTFIGTLTGPMLDIATTGCNLHLQLHEDATALEGGVKCTNTPELAAVIHLK